MLQQSDADTQEHCYEFGHDPFWVHISGLPQGRVSEEVLSNVAYKIGEVLEVKLELKGTSSYKVGKVRIKLDLLALLKSGTIANVGSRKM